MSDTLALDQPLCHDSKCQARHDCKRWRDRKKYGPQTPLHGVDCRELREFVPVDEAAVLRWGV